MKDAKGHGSEGRGGVGQFSRQQLLANYAVMHGTAAATKAAARLPLDSHQNGVAAVPSNFDEAAAADRIRTAITPDTSRATQAPKWITYFGKAAKRARGA